jgi:predicted nucleotidyltransferase
MVDQAIFAKVKAFAELVKVSLPVKRVVLFGSYAQGNARPNSDIDVAVILQNVPANVWKTEAELFRLARDIDFRIEPILVDDTNDFSGFWAEISSYGKVIY